jgi:hypothetical protein
MKYFISVVLVAAILLEGCAILFSGTNAGVRMESTPDNVEVWVNGAKAGVTPCKIELKKNQEYSIEFRKEGYQTRTYRLTNSVGAGWIILDILGGLVPIVIDAATGAWYGLSQDNINAILEKQQ